jgi:hypothetical protein
MIRMGKDKGPGSDLIPEVHPFTCLSQPGIMAPRLMAVVPRMLVVQSDPQSVGSLVGACAV